MPAGLDAQATVGVHSLPLTPFQGLGVVAVWTAGALLLGALAPKVRDALTAWALETLVIGPPARSAGTALSPPDGADRVARTSTSFTIFEGTAEIQRVIIGRAVTGLLDVC